MDVKTWTYNGGDEWVVGIRRFQQVVNGHEDYTPQPGFKLCGEEAYRVISL